MWRDALVLAARLAEHGHAAEAWDFRDRAPRRFDLGIALEVIPTQAQATAALRWWWVPNPEWTSDAGLQCAPLFERILLKTPWSQGLAAWGLGAVVTGFESEDVGGGGEEFATPLRVLHPSGSIARGGVAVCQAWKIVVARGLDRGATLVVANPPPQAELLDLLCSTPQVEILPRVSDEEFRQQQRRAAVHVVASEHEGHGHLFWEGLSCGATVVGTDGGWWQHAVDGYVPVESRPEGRRCLVERRRVDHPALVRALADACEAGAVYRTVARAVYDRERAAFRRRFSELMAEVG